MIEARYIISALVALQVLSVFLAFEMGDSQRGYAGIALIIALGTYYALRNRYEEK